MMSRTLMFITSEGLDLVGQALLIPWGFWYLVHSSYLEGHWGLAIMRYGALCSVQAVGRFFGRLWSPQVVSTRDLTRPQHLIGMVLLAGSSIVLCMTNRYFLMLLAYFGFGFAGATLVGNRSSSSTSHSMIGGLSLGGDFDYALGSNSVSGMAALRSASAGMYVGTGSFGSMPHGSLAHADTDSGGRNAILIFMIVSLASGFLYGEGGNFSHHSAFIPCVVFAIACFVSASLYVSSNRIAYKRMQWWCRLCYVCWPGSGRGDGTRIKQTEKFGARCWNSFLRILSYLPKEPRKGGGDSSNHLAGGAGGHGSRSPLKAQTGNRSAGGRISDGDDADGGGGETDALLEYRGAVPEQFVAISGGNTAHASKAFNATLSWRREFLVDTLMDTPQADFFQILDMYPHAIHGTALDDSVVCYEVLGQARVRALTEAGISPTRLVWHFILRNEYIFRRVAAHRQATATTTTTTTTTTTASAGAGRPVPTPATTVQDLTDSYEAPALQKIMTVLDVKGIEWGSVTSDVISFIKQSGEIMDAHYPGAVQRLVICNAPSWFYQLWAFVARVLPESVRKKIVIIHDTQGLDKYIAPSQRPVAYSGTDTAPLGRHADHLGFVRLAEQWEAGGFVFGAETRVGSAAQLGLAVSAVSAVAVAAGVGGQKSGKTLAPVPENSGADNDDDGDGAEGNVKGNGHTDEESSAGLFGWVQSRFSRAPAAAHLGEKNKFYFDEAKGRWTMAPAAADAGASGSAAGSGGESRNDNASDAWDIESVESSATEVSRSPMRTPLRGKGSGARERLSSEDEDRVGGIAIGNGTGGKSRMTPDEIEEHGLVLAIQAAHLAATIGHRSLPLGDPESGQGFAMAALTKSSRRGGSVGRPFTPGAAAGSAAASQLDAQPDKEALNVLALVTALYLAASFAQAGLLSMLPAWLVVPAAMGGEGYSVKDLALVLSGTALAALHAHIFLRPRIGRVAQASPVRALRVGAGSLAAACLVLPALRQLIWLPSQSLLAIPLPAVLIVWIVWSANLARQSAGCLLSVAARACKASPAVYVLDSLGSLGDICGPLLSALIFGSVLRLEVRYPMDAAFLFTLVAGLASALYVGSLMLHLQFCGDFGIMPDEALAVGPTTKKSGTRRAGRSTSSAVAGSGGSGGIAHLMSVTLGDLALLLGPPAGRGGYGARLLNLQGRESKDV